MVIRVALSGARPRFVTYFVNISAGPRQKKGVDFCGRVKLEPCASDQDLFWIIENLFIRAHDFQALSHSQNVFIFKI
jgi:hypothetical protein